MSIKEIKINQLTAYLIQTPPAVTTWCTLMVDLGNNAPSLHYPEREKLSPDAVEATISHADENTLLSFSWRIFMLVVIPDAYNDKFPYSRTFCLNRQPLSAKGEVIFVMIMCALNTKEIINLIMREADFIIRFPPPYLKKFLKVKSCNLFNTLNKQANLLKDASIKQEKQTSTKIFDSVRYFRGTLDIKLNNKALIKHLFTDPTLQRIDRDGYLAMKRNHTKQFFLIINFVRNNEILDINTLYYSFGLSDECNNIKLDSFHEKKIFMQRCIRQSINEIERSFNNIFFRYGNNHRYGYTYHKGRNEIQFHFKLNSRHLVSKDLYEELFIANSRPMSHREIYDIIMQKRWSTRFNEKQFLTINDLYRLWNDRQNLNERGLVFDTEFYINLSLAMNYFIAEGT